jgi:threonine synthase
VTAVDASRAVGVYRCYSCGCETHVEPARVSCDCGGGLDLPLRPPAPRASTGPASFPSPQTWVADWALRQASLGERPTPLVRWREDAEVWLKCDHMLPTGSFKDRGAQVLAGLAVELGVEHVVVDSSGNAAAALAAHAARAGLRCTVFVPEGASPNKLGQVAAYGAHLSLVNGPRDAAGVEARAFAEQHGALYGGHAVNPHFHDGTKSWIYEVIAEFGRPDTVVLPVGSGSLLLGVLRGLDELANAGWITKLPQFVIAQTTGYASLDPRATAAPSGPRRTSNTVPLAEGIAIRTPTRRQQMLDRLANLDATVCVVEDTAIRAAQRELALSGFYVEPTSAVAWAAWRQQGAAGSTVVALTGHGLKTPA